MEHFETSAFILAILGIQYNLRLFEKTFFAHLVPFMLH